MPLLAVAGGLLMAATFSELAALAFFAALFFFVAIINPRIRIVSLIALMPLVYSGIGIELQGFGLFDLYAALFILLFVLRKCREGLRFDRVPALGWTAVMFAAFIPSLLNTAHLQTSLIGFLRFLYPVMLAWALYDSLMQESDGKFIKQLLRLFVVETVIIALYGIYDAYAHRSLLSAFIGRVQFGLFPEVNYYASYLTLAVPLAYSLLLAEKGRGRKIFFAAALTCLFFSIVLTVSRSAMVVLLFIFLAYSVFMFSHLSGFHKWLSIGLLIFLLSGVGVMVFTETGRKTVDVIALVHRMKSALSGRDRSFAQRLTILEIAASMAAAHPIVGVGFGAFEKTFDDYRGGHLSTQSARSAHNTPLRMLAETGIIGLLAGTIFVISLLRQLYHGFRATVSLYWKTLFFGLSVAVLAYLLLSLALDQLTDPPFWVIITFALATATLAREGKLELP